MARVFHPPGMRSAVDRQRQVNNRLSGLRQQWAYPQMAVVDVASGNTALQIGYLSTGKAALLLNDGSGNRIIQLGQLDDGDDGLALFDASGTCLCTLDNNGLTLDNGSGDTIIQLGQVSGQPTLAFYNAAGTQILTLSDNGLEAKDTAGQTVLFLGQLVSDVPALYVYDTSYGYPRVEVGNLDNGNYGFLVRDPNGNSQEVLPLVEQYVDADINVTATSYTSDGGPTVTALVGSSGRVKVEASAYIATDASDMTGSVGLYIDGSFWGTGAILALSSLGSAIAGNVSSTRIISSLSPGSHSFELRYQASASSGVDFAARSLIVTPL